MRSASSSRTTRRPAEGVNLVEVLADDATTSRPSSGGSRQAGAGGTRTGAAASRCAQRGGRRATPGRASRTAFGRARRTTCGWPRTAMRPKATASGCRPRRAERSSASGACARRPWDCSATCRAAAGRSRSWRIRRCRPSTSPTTSPSSAPRSTAAAWSTACSATSMPAFSTSARRST